MIVIDIGCARYGGDYSIEKLIDEYQPDILYGFDPNVMTSHTKQGKTKIHTYNKAAWIEDGHLNFIQQGLGTHISSERRGIAVRCFDLAWFINGLSDDSIVLKMDAEMTEYTVLPHLTETNADKRLCLALVEFHCHSCRHGTWSHADGCPLTDAPNPERAVIESAFACEIQEWRG